MPALAPTPDEIHRKAVARQLARIKRARECPNAFIEYTNKVPPQNTEIDSRARWAKQDPIHKEWQAEWSESRRSIILAPVGTGKSTQARGRIIHEIGKNHNTLVSIISASELLPKKHVAAMQEMIEHNPRVRHVFPTLRKSTIREDGRESWSAKSLLVARSLTGISDPSVQCFGLFGKILGSRSNILLFDDIINFYNSITEESRDKIFSWLSEGISRLVPGARVWTIGHIWHDMDAIQRFRKKKNWTYHRSECFVVDEDRVRENLKAKEAEEEQATTAATERMAEDVKIEVDIQPHTLPEDEIVERIEAGELKSVAPSVLTTDDILEKREDLGPLYTQMMLHNRLPGDVVGRFEEAWFTRCLKLGRGLVERHPPQGFLKSWDGGEGLCYTGMDLGHRKKAGSDRTVMWTAAVLPNGLRQVVDVRSGLWRGGEMLENIEEVHSIFGSIFCVENNGAQQLLLDFAEYLTCLPVRPHTTTGINKHDFSHGVERMGDELRQGKWMLPCDESLIPGTEIGAGIKGCKTYDPSPKAHTPDHLMGWWICKEGIRLSPSASAYEVEPVDLFTRY